MPSPQQISSHYILKKKKLSFCSDFLQCMEQGAEGSGNGNMSKVREISPECWIVADEENCGVNDVH